MKKSQKLVTIAGLIFSSTSFSFFMMKDIYYDPSFVESSGTVVSILSNALSVTQPNLKEHSVFLHDKNTCNILEVRNIKSVRYWLTVHVPYFLNCNFKYETENSLSEENFFAGAKKRVTNCMNLICRKQGLIINPDKSISKDPSYSFSNIKLNRNIQNQDAWDGGSFSITQEFTSTSGVLVQNTEKGVILHKDGRMKEMTRALREYFVKAPDQEELVNSIAFSHSNTFGNGASERELYQTFGLYHKHLDKEHWDRLQRSVILAVWCLIPKQKEFTNADGSKGVKEMESEMIGLAKDIETKKLFHWTTDLGQDIEALFKYPTAFTCYF